MIGITGYTGFIGKHLLEKFPHEDVLCIGRKQPNKYNWLECDLTLSTIELRDIKFTQFYHLAADPVIKTDKVDILSQLDINVMSTAKILSNINADCEFHFASTAMVYGGQENCTEETSTKPTSVYAATKLMSEILIQQFYNLGYLKNYYIYRLIANVGADATRGVIKELIHKAKTQEIIELLGESPGAQKQYIHVEDTVRAILHDKPGGIYNICTDERLTTEQIIKIIMDALYIKKEYTFLGAKSVWAGDNKFVSLKNDKLRATGWKPLLESTGAIRKAVIE